MRQSFCFHLLYHLLHCLKAFYKFFLTALFAIDYETLFHAYKVRRSKESHFTSMFHQHLIDKCTDTSFAIASCHMDDFKLMLSDRKSLQHFFRML